MKRLLLILAMLLIWVPAITDDGQMFRRNISKTPDLETEHAAIKMMKFYVPAQSSSGELTPVDYYDGTGALVDIREYAKPLVGFYTDGLVEHVPDVGFSGHGKRDFFAAVSFDDGTTFKRKNLSESANLSSIRLGTGRNKVRYPGDVIRSSGTVVGDKVFAAWASRYCAGGNPAYTLVDGVGNDLYPDLFGVAGSQGYSDFADEGYPEVGLVPYACLWTARGTLVQDEDTGLYEIAWTLAERLTSGRRDVNRVEVSCDNAAGCAVTWQEDPDGLRPGQGEGPGEGWSGAIAHQGTDIWYSYISEDNFGLVISDEDDSVEIEEYTGDTAPKVAVPMALPVRLSDNANCKAMGSDPYCYVDFSNHDADGNLILPDDLDTIVQSPDSTLCAEIISWTNPGGTTLDICQTEDGRVLTGRTAATRARINLRPYDRDGDGVYDSAWAIVAYEETKAMGEGSVDNDDTDPIDIGKNVLYHSLDTLNPTIVTQGGMLNAPARVSYAEEDDVDEDLGETFPIQVDEFGNEFYETEIARRTSLLTLPTHEVGDSGLAAMPLFKQGILNQGGPSDVMARRFVVPDSIDPSIAGYNPYAYENMVCEDADGVSAWVYTDGSNPNYVQGYCLASATNLSATNLVSCDNGSSGVDCAAAFPWEGEEVENAFIKVTEWSQTVDNLDDESWENPYDVAKGHRGYLDGDHIMMMYAWSPNWKANTVGNDKYNLYVRRSFDGGLTWTTTPAELGGDGTETCENYGIGSDVTTVCTPYGPGEFEQARNVSQLVGNNITVLDPRFAKTGGPISDFLGIGFSGYDDDVRDESRFFIVYETGDNTTTAEGEPTPLDLFYSRATNYGDDYDLVEYETGTGRIVEAFDWLEHDMSFHSGEASVLANPAGSFFYAAWNQWKEDAEESIYESDAWVRRVMYLDGYIPPTANEPPSVWISSPTNGETFDSGSTIEFSATAIDLEDGDLSSAIMWTSNIDGVIGTSASIGVILSDSEHSVSARVTDSGGITVVAVVGVTIETLPVCIDADGDGYCANIAPLDCNDNDPSINPGATDRGGKFRDYIDNDCDGLVDR